MRLPLRFIVAIMAILAVGTHLAAAEKGPSPNAPPVWFDPDRSAPAGTHYRTFASKLVGGAVSYLQAWPKDLR